MTTTEKVNIINDFISHNRLKLCELFTHNKYQIERSGKALTDWLSFSELWQWASNQVKVTF